MFSSEEIRARLTTKLIGRRVECHDEVASTNDLVKALDDEGALVVADRQIKGRGRTGRGWISPSGGLWFSILLRPAVKLSSAPILTLMAGVAVARALSQGLGLAAEVKWPNDVEIAGKKTCGILAEVIGSTEGYKVVIGIGLNANFHLDELPVEVQSNATTLRKVLGRDIDRVELLVAVVEELENLYFDLVRSKSGRDKILKEWRRFSSTLGRKVSINLNSERLQGLASEINSDGGLLLKLADGSIRKVLAGDVILLRVQD